MRKIYFFLFLCLIAIQATAQTNSKPPASSAQLKKVLQAVQKDFKEFRGEKVKEEEGDVVYASTVTLVGTTENQVMDFASGKSYMAKLGEGLNEKEAKTLIENWKKKIGSATADGFEITKDDLKNNEYKRIAYLFMGDASSISIYAMKYADDTNYSAYLLVMKL